MIVNTIDLKFLGARAAVAAFAVPDENGFTLVECGPFSTNDNLLAGLAEAGIDPSEVHTLLLTHIHFDHAGAAWWWARRGVTVYVHPRGRKHLVDPGRLYASAARIYGEARMEELWGRMERIPPRASGGSSRSGSLEYWWQDVDGPPHTGPRVTSHLHGKSRGLYLPAT